jgi:cytochrome c biogenesis protein CcmG, thiol:disulfide interchange protein DsbE
MVINMHDTGQLNPDAGPIPAENKQQETSIVRTRVIPIVAGTLVVGLLALLAYALFAPESLRVDAGRTVTDFGAVVYDDPRPAPSFVLSTFDGEPFDLSEHSGQVVVLNFWASWCGPCIAEMPMLNRVADEFVDDNVVVVGVNVWDSRDAAERFVDELNITYPIVEDEVATSIAVEYGLTGVPETFVLNSDGEIVTFFRGEFSNAQQIRDMIALAR